MVLASCMQVNNNTPISFYYYYSNVQITNEACKFNMPFIEKQKKKLQYSPP